MTDLPARHDIPIRRIASLLPIAGMMLGLAVMAIAPRGADSPPDIDPVITGSIAAAPLFRDQTDGLR